MDLSVVEPRSRWMTLLWKDLQQVKFVLLAITLGLLSIQAIVVIWAMTGDPNEKTFRLESLPFCTFCGPILVAIGCAGMLIGQERQSNTWNWQSSLPISWQESLSSKIFVTLSVSIATAICLAVIPAILMAAGQVSFFSTPDAIEQFNTFALVGAIGLIQVVAVCFLTSLLIREPINALASAGMFLVVGQWLLAAILFGVFLRISPEREPTASVLFGMSIFTLSLVGAILAYRWRWGSGQLFELRLGNRNRSSALIPIAYRLRYSEGKAPSVWGMLLIQSWQNSMGLRLVALLVALFFVIVASGTSQVAGNLSHMLILLGIFLCGLSVFEGDRALGRFRFLADRGVNPVLLVTSRLAVVVALVVVFLLACSPFVSTPPGQLAGSLAVLSLAFSVPALMSMAFPKPVMAGGIALVLCIGSFAWGATSNWSNFPHCVMIQSALLLTTIYALARRWIVLDDFRVPLFAFLVALIVLFSPWPVLALVT